MPSLLRSLHLAPALLYIAGFHSSAQEPVPLDRAREFARSLSENASALANPPVHVDADVLNPFGIHAGEAGALVVPDRNVAASALAEATDVLVPVGELFLRNVILSTNGEAVEKSKLQHITVAMQDQKVEVPIYFLAAKKTAEGKLELLIFGKATEPLAHVALGKVASRAKMPIELEAEKIDDHSGMLTLHIAGQYEAELVLRRTDEK